MKKSIYKKRWFVYIVKCKDQTLYTGISRDVEKRVKEHSNTKRCRYTRSRQPVKLVYKQRCSNHSVAMKREKQIKRLDKKKKLELVKAN